LPLSTIHSYDFFMSFWTLILSLVVAFHVSSRNATAQDVKLQAILTAYDKRELLDDPPDAHRAWLKTAAGREDAAYLAENYGNLDGVRKQDLPTELARTGDRHVVPLLKQALADPKSGKSVLSGLFYACHLAGAGQEFRKQLAPGVVPWIGKGTSLGSDIAVELLPVMDRQLASETLLKDEFLSKDAPLVAVVLASLNEAGIEVPMSRISPLLKSWETIRKDGNSEYRIIRGYREAVRAWAFHEPDAAVAFVEQLIKKDPMESEGFAEIPLAAARLNGLYDRLCDHSDNPKDFARLPEVAKMYFAVVYFDADCSNGGLSQALGNSTGDYLPLVRRAYQEIGATEALAYVDWMCKPFGAGGPSVNRDKRRLQMESMKPNYYEQEERLSAEWRKRSGVDSIPSTYWLINRFAARHASSLRPFVNARNLNE
jgi:hypothetical protein